jgi:hypothetical protein
MALGEEPLGHLVPVCSDHHYELHKFIKRHDLPLWDGHTAYAEWLYARRRRSHPVQPGEFWVAAEAA